MKYFHVRWRHEHADEPVDLYSENDDDGWEIRKVETYADGRADVASTARTTGSTILAEVPMPPLDVIAADPEFEPRQITKEEFEHTWDAALRQHESKVRTKANQTHGRRSMTT